MNCWGRTTSSTSASTTLPSGTTSATWSSRRCSPIWNSTACCDPPAHFTQRSSSSRGDRQRKSWPSSMPGGRSVAALNYLEERGDLLVEAVGARQGYRRLRQPHDRDALVASLAERFLE